MEIDANMKWGAVNGLPPATRSAPAAKPPAPGDSFASSTALETALKNSPDVRPDAVARGRAAVSNPNYPSADTLKKLSAFLATQLQSSAD